MDRAEGVLSFGRTAARSLGALGKVLVAAATFRRARRTAVRAFREALIETGVPPAAADELAQAYPDLDLADLVSRRSR